jgi:hypothetical protein
MEIVSVCTSIPIYFVLSIKRVLLSGDGLSGTLKTYSIRGALLYFVLFSECGSRCQAIPFSRTYSRNTEI